MVLSLMDEEEFYGNEDEADDWSPNPTNTTMLVSRSPSPRTPDISRPPSTDTKGIMVSPRSRKGSKKVLQIFPFGPIALI